MDFFTYIFDHQRVPRLKPRFKIVQRMENFLANGIKLPIQWFDDGMMLIEEWAEKKGLREWWLQRSGRAPPAPSDGGSPSGV